MKKSSGADYAPNSKTYKVEGNVDFDIAAIGIDHGHIYGMLEGLVNAGANLKSICDYNKKNPETLNKLRLLYPEAKVVSDLEEILTDSNIKLVCTAGVNSERAEIGLQALEYGKDIFSDKPAITSMETYKEIVKKTEETNKKIYIYYGELIHNECALYAKQLIDDDYIGDVIQVIGTGPHREGPEGSRPDWFYEKEKFGGIITDIGSHQIAQYLAFSGATTAEIKYSSSGNYLHSKKQNFEDFGEFSLVGDNGTSGYFRVDWFTPKGLSSWSDGRIFILGTKGTIELRKYCDIAISSHGENNIYIATENGEEYIDVNGKVGFNYFKKIIEDSLSITKTVLNQQEILEPTRLAILAQAKSEKVGWAYEK